MRVIGNIVRNITMEVSENQYLIYLQVQRLFLCSIIAPVTLQSSGVEGLINPNDGNNFMKSRAGRSYPRQETIEMHLTM